jgi:hypothetical protein
MIWLALAVVGLPVLFWVVDSILVGKNGASRF